MEFDRNKPYNKLPKLPPKVELDSKAILKNTIEASRALAELKGAGKEIPNQKILIDSILLQESKASSEIENIVTTYDALYRAFSANMNTIDPATREVLSYREAVWGGYNALKHRDLLTTNIFISIYQKIKKTQASIRNVTGVKISNTRTGEVIYTPPEGVNVIRDLLKNIEEYINNEDALDPLIKMAIMHYQFEAIHPFSDGNGRTGRILNILYLIQKGLLEFPILYLSKYIIENKGNYYRLLKNVTEKSEWEQWIIYMLEAVKNTSIYTSDKIHAIRDLLNETLNFAKENLPQRVYSKELIELLFYQPYTKVQFLVEANIAKRQTAAEYLKELEKIGILKSQMVGKERLYLNVKLYDLLTK
jgi:Fic family protein